MKTSISILAILLFSTNLSEAFSYGGSLPPLTLATGEFVVTSRTFVRKRDSSVTAASAKRRLQRVWERSIGNVNGKIQRGARSSVDFTGNPGVYRKLYRFRKAVFTYSVRIRSSEVKTFQERMQDISIRRKTKTRFGSIIFKIDLKQMSLQYNTAEQGAAANP